jgi:hypothetical protein
MLTVTYLCAPVSGVEAKNDLRCVLQWIKRRKGQQIGYIWFAEFQRSGSIHFHIVLECGVTQDDRNAWARYWSQRTAKKLGPYCSLRTKRTLDPELAIFDVNAHEKTWEKIRSEDGSKRYIAKYAGKPHQKKVPSWFGDIGRFWGVSNSVRKSAKVSSIEPIDEDEVREILTENKHRLASVDVLPRYIWGFGKK